MNRAFRRLFGSTSGAVAPTVALSLFALIACGGVAFDYARLVAMDSELQDAADQAALAAASQLDGQSGAMGRAEAAARSLISNSTLFANDSGAMRVVIPASVAATQADPDPAQAITFYATRDDAEAETNGWYSTTGGTGHTDAAAKFVRVRVAPRTAYYALTPIVAAFSSGAINAMATAGIGSAICKVPPVMVCNPDEPSTNSDMNLAFTPTRGVGLRLVTGNATVPGNFGWLEAGLSNGTPDLAAALGYNTPPGDCQAVTGVTTKTGMDAAVLNAFNTRFDVYSNGNTTCPAQGSGTCSPARNTRKDVVCVPDNTNAACNNDNWDEAGNPYRPRVDGNGDGLALDPATSPYPMIMGYPRDLCHALPRNAQKCGIRGTGSWDRDAYFRVNYGWTSGFDWQSATGLPANASRYEVYSWELAHGSVTVGGVSRGIDVPQVISNNEAAFSYPATGRAGVAASGSQPDRRKISVAVINCQAVQAKGKTTNVPVPTWLEVFLVEPALNRSDKGGGKTLYTDQKDIYVEMIGTTTASGSAGAGQVVRRDVPYLIK